MSLVIDTADDHHRHETALGFRDEGGPPTVLAYLADMRDSGPVILPTHRLVRGALPMDPAALRALDVTLFQRTILEPILGLDTLLAISEKRGNLDLMSWFGIPV